MTQEKIEIPFGAYDSELKGWEYTIPEGMEATIENGKVIVRRRETEDESHRKWILEYLYDGLRKAHEQFKEQFKSAIAWLEKRKDSNDMEFYEGYTLGFDDGMKSVEQKEHLTTEEKMNHPLYLEGFDIGKRVGEVTGKPSEWSEEDKKTLDELIHYFEGLLLCLATQERHTENSSWLSFLKSLRPSWKPSEEQMKALHNAIIITGTCSSLDAVNTSLELDSLYNDIKKLM